MLYNLVNRFSKVAYSYLFPQKPKQPRELNHLEKALTVDEIKKQLTNHYVYMTTTDRYIFLYETYVDKERFLIFYEKEFKGEKLADRYIVPDNEVENFYKYFMRFHLKYILKYAFYEEKDFDLNYYIERALNEKEYIDDTGCRNFLYGN